MNIRQTRLMTLAFLVLATAVPAELSAHGDATLESSVRSVPAGGSLTLRGSLFTPGATHRLVLRGSLDEHSLGEVTADSDSTFTRDVFVPNDLRPGRYRVVAIAPDGDEVATLDLPVLAAEQTAGAGAETGPGGGDPSPASVPQARADEIEVQRSRAGVEWGIIGLLIGLSGGLGLGLVRRS